MCFFAWFGWSSPLIQQLNAHKKKESQTAKCKKKCKLYKWFYSEIRGNEIKRWFRLQIKRKKKEKKKVNGVSQAGPHGEPVTKQNCFLPWLTRSRTAVKHKGPADALAFHSSQNPTSSQTIPKYIHDMLELPPCSLNTHAHTHRHILSVTQSPLCESEFRLATGVCWGKCYVTPREALSRYVGVKCEKREWENISVCVCVLLGWKHQSYITVSFSRYQAFVQSVVTFSKL